MKMIRGQIFLTTGEVAFHFGVTARTVLRWVSSTQSDGPQLNAIKGPNNRLYFRKEEIDRLLDHYFGSIPEPAKTNLPKIGPSVRNAGVRERQNGVIAAR